MSKAKVEKSVGELLAWLPNYDWEQRQEMIAFIGSALGGLPGGEMWEDLGYETLGFAWKELEMVADVLASVDDKWDNEQVTALLFADEEEDE